MKIGIIGLGWVGSSVASSTLHTGISSSLLLYDLDSKLAEGEAMDLSHGSSFYPTSETRAVKRVGEMKDCDAIAIAAGAAGTKDQSRLELASKNARVMASIAAELEGFGGIVFILTNPVDIMTRVFVEASGLDPGRVLGTGTTLDTSRLRELVGRQLSIDPRSVHAYVLGEHGDSEVCVWSSATVGGRPLSNIEGWRSEDEQTIAHEVRRAAYEIIARKGATNHAIGFVTGYLLRWLLRGEERIVTVSRVHEGLGFTDGVAFSLPTVLSRNGASRVFVPQLSDAESKALARSVSVLDEGHRQLSR